MKNKSEKTLKIIKKEKTQKILKHWKDKPDKWIRYSKLRKEFVRKYSNIIKHPNDYYFNPETMEKSKSRPKPLYNYDSQLSRDLKELIDVGILENKKIPQKKGKPESYYRPKKEFKNEGLRFQNKESFDFFPSEKIIDFDIKDKEYQNNEYIGNKVILYGLSKEILEKMPNEQEHLENLIKEINKVFNRISKKTSKSWEMENKKRLKQFLNKTKNEKFKEFLNDQNIRILGRFSVDIDLNKYDKNSIDLTKSKEHFFLQFRYGISTQESNISNLENNEKIIDFKRVIDDLSDIEYGKIWCKTFFHKEYDLTRKDIHKLIRWGWNNRDFFDIFFPMDLALSVYGSRTNNDLIRL